MRTSRYAWLPSLCFVVAAAAHAAPPEGGPDDHQVCYKAKAADPKFGAVSGVTLTDAFETDPAAKVVKSAFLCNPADNGGAGVIDDTTHLAAYKIKSSIKHVPRTELLVVDTLGAIRVDTKKAELLMSPGSIVINGTPAVPDFLSHGVDQYKCYKVKVSKSSFFNQQSVAFTDQFSGTAKSFDIRKAKHLCLPVAVNGVSRKNPAGHLMCYQAKAARGEPKHAGVIGIRVGNAFAQLEGLSTKKEEEICFPAVVNPTCGDNKVNQPTEECDGSSDSACPGQCSSNCGCWRPHAFTLDPALSRIEVRGMNTTGAGLDRSFSYAGLAGTITISTGNQIKPGQYELAVPTVSLPPLDITVPGFGTVGTACVFLQEDPQLPGSGLAGVGALDCRGGGLVDVAPSPVLYSHQDHCSDGVSSCDSGNLFASQCTPPWRFDQAPLGPTKIHAGTGVCVPAAPTDAMCTATDPLTATSANLEDGGDLHPGTCNSPLYGRVGEEMFNPGDAVLVLNAAIDIRGAGDPCTTPPSTAPIRGPLTTSSAVSTIMDAFPGLPGTGKVQALKLFGVPFTCVDEPLPQHGDPLASVSGVSFVTAVSALDLVLPDPLGTADINTGLVLKAQ